MQGYLKMMKKHREYQGMVERQDLGLQTMMVIFLLIEKRL